MQHNHAYQAFTECVLLTKILSTLNVSSIYIEELCNSQLERQITG